MSTRRRGFHSNCSGSLPRFLPSCFQARHRILFLAQLPSFLLLFPSLPPSAGSASGQFDLRRRPWPWPWPRPWMTHRARFPHRPFVRPSVRLSSRADAGVGRSAPNTRPYVRPSLRAAFLCGMTFGRRREERATATQLWARGALRRGGGGGGRIVDKVKFARSLARSAR